MKFAFRFSYAACRTSHEVRGLKYFGTRIRAYFISRTSHEVRGLKYFYCFFPRFCVLSHLTRGAWIEIEELPYYLLGRMSHLTRGAWIEIGRFIQSIGTEESHLTRGAWIEMYE